MASADPCCGLASYQGDSAAFSCGVLALIVKVCSAPDFNSSLNRANTPMISPLMKSCGKVDLTVDLHGPQRLESLAGAQHTQGFTGRRVIDDAVHGAAQMLVRCIEDRVVHAVQTPDHVHALIQVGIDPAAMPQHDDALRLVLEQHGMMRCRRSVKSVLAQTSSLRLSSAEAARGWCRAHRSGPLVRIQMGDENVRFRCVGWCHAVDLRCCCA